MGFDLGGLLARVAQGVSPADAPGHFEQVAQASPPGLLQEGLSAMFRSDQTPPFGQMAGQLFGQANPTQQAGMLNQLIAAMGPSVLSSLAAGAGGGVLGSLVSRLRPGSGEAPTVTPEQASQVTPEQVQQMADHAQQHSPGLIEQMSAFYAQHPTLVKTLGGAALTIAISHMAQNRAA